MFLNKIKSFFTANAKYLKFCVHLRSVKSQRHSEGGTTEESHQAET